MNNLHPDLKRQLAHVLWIGGAADAGKTTIAGRLAERHRLQVYHYDHHDLPHHKTLAQTMPRYQATLTASLEERWVQPVPEDLLHRTLRTMQDRFPLVLEDLLALPTSPRIVAEGFGLTPTLLHPLLTSPQQAIWLFPTIAFKRESMQRRNKPSFAHKVSDPARATHNLIERDRLLGEHLRQQAISHHLPTLEIDGSRSIADIVDLVSGHFGTLLTER